MSLMVLARAPDHYDAATMSVGSSTPDIKVLDGETEANPWGEDGFTFGDVLDMINPLQQIPGVSTVYRAITGDEIAPAARLLGGSLLGGLPGLAMSAINTFVEETTGSDIGGTILAAFTGDDADEAVTAPMAVAAATTPPAQSAPATQNAPAAPAQVAMASPATAPATQNPAAGATSGNENAGAIQQPMHFFTPASGQRVIYSRPQPGALNNSLFQPLTSAPQPAAAGLSPPAAAAAPRPSPAPAPAPVPPQSAAANPAATASLSQAAPAASTAPAAPAAPASAEARAAANRAAMLAFARDMKALAEGHAGYNANERLQKLAAAHAKTAGPKQ